MSEFLFSYFNVLFKCVTFAKDQTTFFACLALFSYSAILCDSAKAMTWIQQIASSMRWIRREQNHINSLLKIHFMTILALNLIASWSSCNESVCPNKTKSRRNRMFVETETGMLNGCEYVWHTNQKHINIHKHI